VLERVLKTISRYNMLAPGDRVIVAVSGGADSVCLLTVLSDLATRLRVTLAGVAHFNHKLRGEASDEDERSVALLAARLELPFYRAEAHMGLARDNLEQAGRRARRDFYASLMQGREVDCVALGHTRDDQAETVLFRLLRGSGLAGLAGIYPVTPDRLIRPLIGVTRAEVEEFLRSRRIDWREDASNRELRFARNRIRHDLLPQLRREWNPRIEEALANLADLALEEEHWWRGELDRGADQLFESSGGIELNAPVLADLPRAAARRLVRRAILRAKGDLLGVEFQHIERILDLAAREAGQGQLRLPGVHVIRSFDWIRLAPPYVASLSAPVKIAIPGTYTAPDGSQIHLEMAYACVNLSVELSWGRIPAQVVLRGWRPGDHYRPIGQSRDQKLKEMFQRARVPSWRRRFWPILSSGNKILWARRFGPAAEFASGDVLEPVLRISESGIPVR
jgi:tRNA(Ile)-lysidine synthase